MLKLKSLILATAFAIVASGSACSDDSPRVDGGSTDTAPQKDLPLAADTSPPVDVAVDSAPADRSIDPDTSPLRDLSPDAPTLPQIDCKNNPCHTYVISRIILPTNTSEAQAYGYDYDHNAVNDNVFGSLLATMSAVDPSLRHVSQDALDLDLYSGKKLSLFVVQASSLTTDPAPVLQAHIASTQACCPGKETDLPLCRSTAISGCFSGAGVFTVSPTSPTNEIFSGIIKAGEITFGPASLEIDLPFFLMAQTVHLHLQAARIRGVINTQGITSGIITGVITQTELNNTVVPALAKSLQNTLDDPNNSTSSKQQLLSLFDQDKNGKISAAEIASNSLIANFLGGDVDVDHDGVYELSVGVGFEAVKATIQ